MAGALEGWLGCWAGMGLRRAVAPGGPCGKPCERPGWHVGMDPVWGLGLVPGCAESDGLSACVPRSRLGRQG